MPHAHIVAIDVDEFIAVIITGHDRVIGSARHEEVRPQYFDRNALFIDILMGVMLV
jgi:hypothetical protein